MTGSLGAAERAAMAALVGERAETSVELGAVEMEMVAAAVPTSSLTPTIAVYAVMDVKGLHVSMVGAKLLPSRR